MGCCCSTSGSQVTPLDTPKKRPLTSLFLEREIISSGRETPYFDPRQKKKPVEEKKSPKKQPPVIRERPPPPKKELELEKVDSLEGHSQYVDIAGWSPDEAKLLSASSDRTAFLWDISLPNKSSKVELTGSEFEYPASSLAWSQDGKSFVLGHDDGKVTLWSSSGQHIFTWWPHEAPVACVQINGDGSAPLILSAGDCAAVSQYTPEADYQELTQLYFSNAVDLTYVEWVDETRFLTADINGNLELHNFDLEKLKKKIQSGNYEDKEKAHRTFSGHDQGVYQVKMQPGSSSRFATCSVDCTVKIWNLKSKSEPLEHSLEDHCGYVTSLLWMKDHSGRLLSASFDYTVKIWDAVKGQLLHSLEKHHDAVTGLAVSPNNQYLVSSGQDGDLHFWGLSDGRHINTYEGEGRILGTFWNPNGDEIVATSYKIVSVLRVDVNQRIINEREIRQRVDQTLQQLDVPDSDDSDAPSAHESRSKKKKKKRRSDDDDSSDEDDNKSKKKKDKKGHRKKRK